MTTRARRPLPELPTDLQQYRCIDKIEVAALMGISPKTVDQGTYGDSARGIAPWAPPSFLIGRRRVWRLRDVVRWIDKKAKAALRSLPQSDDPVLRHLSDGRRKALEAITEGEK